MALDIAETEIAGQVREIATRLKPLDGPLLPILHEVQAAFGCVPQAALPVIAEVLNLTAAEVHGVASFYHDFRDAPAGRRVVRICRAEACKASGGDALADSLREWLGIDWHETTPDGAVTLEPVYCLGLCACAPAAMIGAEVHGRLDAGRLAVLIGEGSI